MPLATLRQVLDEAAKGGYGVGAFIEEIHFKLDEMARRYAGSPVGA